MKKLVSLSLIAAAAISAFAFTTPKAKSQISYNVDTKATSATWWATKVTGKHNGTIAITKGNIVADGKTITSGSFEFDMNSITDVDLTDKGYNDKLVNHLKSDDWFCVTKFPKANFVITKVTLKSGNDYDVTGKLTIKGITNEISFPAMIKMDEKAIVTIAKITVNRVKFDIKYGSASVFESIGDKAISDNFDLNVNVVATIAAK